MRFVTPFIALLLALFAGACPAQVYKCKAGATTSFSDKPCSEGSEVKLKTPTGIPQGDIQFEIATTYYPVTGRTYPEMFRHLIGQNAGGFAGWARWDVNYRFDTLPRAEGCSVDRLHIRVVGQVTMPKWETLDSATPAEQSNWHVMYAGLKRHEDGHIQNGREFALLLKERVLGMGTVPCDTILARSKEVYQTLYTNLQNRDADYDRRTQHGLRQDNPE